MTCTQEGLKEFENEIDVTYSYKWAPVLKTGLLKVHPLFMRKIPWWVWKNVMELKIRGY